MKFETSGWTAQIDRMPSAASFRTYGTVTVENSGVSVLLTESPIQDKSHNLRLELHLIPSLDPSAQVLTDKFVEYKKLGNSKVTGVTIYHDDVLVVTIDKVLISD
jgi:hypothetical protein